METPGSADASPNGEARRLRRSFEDERRQYVELFEYAPFGYLATDIHGTIRNANAAACVLFKTESRFLVGKPLALFVGREDLYRFRAFLRHIPGTNGIQQCTVHMHGPRGVAFDAELTVGVMRDWRSHAAGLRWLIQDTTERRSHEENIQKMNLLLEARVLERTAELEEAGRLQQSLLARAECARAEAEEANRAKDQLLD